MDDSATEKETQDFGEKLKKAYQCPICLGLLKNPASAECLHKFCKECIEQQIKIRKRPKCPICQCPISKRSMRSVALSTHYPINSSNVENILKAINLDHMEMKNVKCGSPLLAFTQTSQLNDDSQSQPSLETLPVPYKMETPKPSKSTSSVKTPARQWGNAGKGRKRRKVSSNESGSNKDEENRSLAEALQTCKLGRKSTRNACTRENQIKNNNASQEICYKESKHKTKSDAKKVRDSRTASVILEDKLQNEASKRAMERLMRLTSNIKPQNSVAVKSPKTPTLFPSPAPQSQSLTRKKQSPFLLKSFNKKTPSEPSTPSATSMKTYEKSDSDSPDINQKRTPKRHVSRPPIIEDDEDDSDKDLPVPVQDSLQVTLDNLSTTFGIKTCSSTCQDSVISIRNMKSKVCSKKDRDIIKIKCNDKNDKKHILEDNVPAGLESLGDDEDLPSCGINICIPPQKPSSSQPKKTHLSRLNGQLLGSHNSNSIDIKSPKVSQLGNFDSPKILEFQDEAQVNTVLETPKLEVELSHVNKVLETPCLPAQISGPVTPNINIKDTSNIVLETPKLQHMQVITVNKVLETPILSNISDNILNETNNDEDGHRLVSAKSTKTDININASKKRSSNSENEDIPENKKLKFEADVVVCENKESLSNDILIDDSIHDKNIDTIIEKLFDDEPDQVRNQAGGTVCENHNNSVKIISSKFRKEYCLTDTPPQAKPVTDGSKKPASKISNFVKNIESDPAPKKTKPLGSIQIQPLKSNKAAVVETVLHPPHVYDKKTSPKLTIDKDGRKINYTIEKENPSAKLTIIQEGNLISPKLMKHICDDILNSNVDSCAELIDSFCGVLEDKKLNKHNIQEGNCENDKFPNNVQSDDVNVDHTALIFGREDDQLHENEDFPEEAKITENSDEKVTDKYPEKYTECSQEIDSLEGFTYHNNETNFDEIQFRKTFGLEENIEESNICDEDKILYRLSQKQNVTSIKDSQNQAGNALHFGNGKSSVPSKMNIELSNLLSNQMESQHITREETEKETLQIDTPIKFKHPQSSSTQNKTLVSSPCTGTGHTTISGTDHEYTTQELELMKQQLRENEIALDQLKNIEEAGVVVFDTLVDQRQQNDRVRQEKVDETFIEDEDSFTQAELFELGDDDSKSSDYHAINNADVSTLQPESVDYAEVTTQDIAARDQTPINEHREEEGLTKIVTAIADTLQPCEHVITKVEQSPLNKQTRKSRVIGDGSCDEHDKPSDENDRQYDEIDRPSNENDKPSDDNDRPSDESDKSSDKDNIECDHDENEDKSHDIDQCDFDHDKENVNVNTNQARQTQEPKSRIEVNTHQRIALKEINRKDSESSLTLFTPPRPALSVDSMDIAPTPPLAKQEKSPVIVSKRRSDPEAKEKKVINILLSGGHPHWDLKKVHRLVFKSRHSSKVAVRLLTVFSDAVTHIIFPHNDTMTCERTRKYLQGLAGGKWLVSMEWILQCISIGRIVSEVPYEMRGDNYWPNSYAPKSARLCKILKQPPLFTNLVVYFVGEIHLTDSATLSQLLELVGINIKPTATFGCTQLSCNPATQTKVYPLIDHNVTSSEQTEKELGEKPLTVDWVLECISQWRVIPLDQIDE